MGKGRMAWMADDSPQKVACIPHRHMRLRQPRLSALVQFISFLQKNALLMSSDLLIVSGLGPKNWKFCSIHRENRFMKCTKCFPDHLDRVRFRKHYPELHMISLDSSDKNSIWSARNILKSLENNKFRANHQ